MKLAKLNLFALSISLAASPALAERADAVIVQAPNVPQVYTPAATSVSKMSTPTSSRYTSSKPATSVSGSNKPATASNPPAVTSKLQPGDVFGLVTLGDDHRVDGQTVVIYADGTLGINEPSAPGYLFEAIHLPEYKLLLAPEPLTAVKINDKGVFYLNNSLYNPSPIFDAKGLDLRVAGGNPVVCPSWNSVLVLAKYNENTPCKDAISVDLGIIPIIAPSFA